MIVDGPRCDGSPQYRIEALAKGLQVLQVLAEPQSGKPLTVSGLAARLHFPQPTTFRIVATLEEFGFVDRRADGSLRAGISALKLGGSAYRGNGLVDASEQALRTLAAETGETVNLGVLTQDRVLYLARLRNADLVTANVQVGSTLPAQFTSMGKILLACLDDAEVRSRLTAGSFAQKAGPRAIKDIESFCAELQSVRRDGYATQDEELARGLRSVAVGVGAGRDGVFAAINVAASVDNRSMQEFVDECLDPLSRAAANVALRLESS